MFILEAGLDVPVHSLTWAATMAAAYRERHHIAGMQPSSVPPRAAPVNAWIPHTVSYLHPLVTPGIFVPQAAVWRDFVAWMHNAGPYGANAFASSLRRERRDVRGEALPGHIADRLTPHPLHGSRDAPEERWDAWFMAFSEVRHVLTLRPPAADTAACSMTLAAASNESAKEAFT